MTGKPDLTLDCLVHDLNNVFQTIIDAAELLSHGEDSALASQVILRSVDQGRSIVASLLEKDHGPVSFAKLAESSMGFARDFVASTKGPRLEFDCDIAEGVAVGLKRSAAERVLINLFLNAAQAAQAAGRDRCRIRIEANAENGEARVAISDDGPGIPDSALAAIFAPGYSTDRKHSGLGLHIVETLVGSAGGTVSAANSEAGGAVFHIRLPLASKAVGSAQ